VQPVPVRNGVVMTNRDSSTVAVTSGGRRSEQELEDRGKVRTIVIC
jgi:hypothetical protein